MNVIGHAPRDSQPTGKHVGHIPKVADLPLESHVAVGTLAKWANYPVPEDDDYPYDLLLIDEAYQVTATALAQVGHLAPRLVLVGDPGQIAPVVTAILSRIGDYSSAGRTVAGGDDSWDAFKATYQVTQRILQNS